MSISFSRAIVRKLFQSNCLLQMACASSHESRRYLFSSDILGLENFERQRQLTLDKTAPIRENFVERMEKYLAVSDKNTVFTDDLKTMVYIAESAEDLELLEKMVKRYETQTKELGFSHFHFGPIIQRLYHKLDKPDIAYKLFTTPVLRHVFKQASSAMILMDLLFEHEQYVKVLEVMDMVTSNADPQYRYPVDCITLFCAACLKLNSSESYERMKSLMKSMSQVNSEYSRVSPRSAVFSSLLALKQNEPGIALELLSLTQLRTPSVPVAMANTKVLIYLRLNRLDEALGILRSYMENDVPDHVQGTQEIFPDVMQEVKSRLGESHSLELKSSCDTVCDALQLHNHVSSRTLEEHVFATVFRKPKYQDSYHRRRNPVSHRRTGLSDNREKLVM